MPLVGMAILVGRHADYGVAIQFRMEGAADAAVSAGRRHAALWRTQFDHRLLDQRLGRAVLHAGAAGDAIGVHEGLRLACGHGGFIAAAVDGQGVGPLDVLTGAHAAVADDALRWIEDEIRVRIVAGLGPPLPRGDPVAAVLDAQRLGHVLQFTIAVGRAAHAIQRVVRNVEFDHAAAQFLEPLRAGRDHHPLLCFGRTGSRIALAPLDLDQANPAGAESVERIGGAQFGHIDAGLGRGAHHRGSPGNRDALAIDRQVDRLAYRNRDRRSKVCVSLRHEVSHGLDQ